MDGSNGIQININSEHSEVVNNFFKYHIDLTKTPYKPFKSPLCQLNSYNSFKNCNKTYLLLFLFMFTRMVSEDLKIFSK